MLTKKEKRLARRKRLAIRNHSVLTNLFLIASTLILELKFESFNLKMTILTSKSNTNCVLPAAKGDSCSGGFTSASRHSHDNNLWTFLYKYF